MAKAQKVGEILLKAGIIDEVQLTSALSEQQQWGCRLGLTLIKLEMVEEKDLIRALAVQFGLPVATLTGKRIPPEALALVPARIAIEHSVIPLFVKRDGNAGEMFLGMEDPTNVELVDDLSFRTGLKIQPVMVGPTDLGKAIERYYLRDNDALGNGSSAVFGESMGERSLSFSEAKLKLRPARQPGSSPSSFPEIDLNRPISSKIETPASRDNEFHFVEKTPEVPGRVVQEVERVVSDNAKTRGILKAITQLLVEQGILSFDQIEARIAKLSEGDF